MKIPLRILLILILGGMASAQERRTPGKLPDDVAAIVRGEIVSMNEFRVMLVRRYAETEDGRNALTHHIEQVLVEAERKKRNLTITDVEVRASITKAETDVRKASAGTQTLDDVLREQKRTRAEFFVICRDFLVRQRLAQQDLGVHGEVSQAQLGVWLESLKRKRGVFVGGPGLPAGVHASVGGRRITDQEYGKALIEALPRGTLNGVLWDLAIAKAVQQDLKRGNVTVTENDLDAAVEGLRARFKNDPRFKTTTLTFEQYVQAARHCSLAELRRDVMFVAQVGLAKSVRRLITADEVRTHWEKSRSRYGERRSFIHLLIKADDRPTAFGGVSRTPAQAKDIIDTLYVRYLRGTPFESLVKESSEDRTATSRPDRIILATRETPLPENLKATIFSTSVGEVVGPLRTAYGYHLVKVMKVEAEKGFEQVRGRVMDDLVRDRRDRARLKILQDEKIVLRY